MASRTGMRFGLQVVACALGLMGPGCVVAQDFPVRPVRLIAPFPAGGGVDIVARLLAQKLSEGWGQQVVVDNRTGASGAIGTEIAARASPDGHTLLMGNVATHAVNVSLFRKLAYDPVRDFEPITLVATVPEILVVHPAVPARSVAELLQLARAKPGLTFGSAGHGSPPHLAGELFKSMGKVELVHVPYKGSAPALADLMGGQITMYFSNILSAMPLVKSGRLRALGVTTLKRSNVAPDVPTIAEAGLPGYEEYNWYGLLAPARTPKVLVARLHGNVTTILKSPEVVDRLSQQGAEIVASAPQAFASHIRDEIVKYAAIVKSAGIRAE